MNCQLLDCEREFTYTFVHSEARSWSIPSEDPYEEAARQLLEQAPRSPDVKDEHLKEAYITEFLLQPPPPTILYPTYPTPHVLESAMALDEAGSTFHLHPLQPIRDTTIDTYTTTLPSPTTSHISLIFSRQTRRLERLTTYCSQTWCEAGESIAAAAARHPGPTGRSSNA
ncbi:hypothetical protein Tco_0438348 [Tanacetum coccineum]